MRVNYQGLLNQTLGAVGSTASTLKFLHNQDPNVIEQKTQKAKQKQKEEEEKAKQEQREKEAKELDEEIFNKIGAAGNLERSIVKAAEKNYSGPSQYLENAALNKEYADQGEQLNNIYANVRSLSDLRFNKDPSLKNLNRNKAIQSDFKTFQENIQDKANQYMARSMLQKMITTNDQEESLRLRKQLLGMKGGINNG